jgi:predicted branched-subunit amino acid permease
MSAAAPIAIAIGVFGVVDGAAAGPVLGPALAVVSSLMILSGGAQFTMVALLVAGAGPWGVIGAVGTLALRHIPLGAVLRPRLPASRVRRGLVSWFLIDETTGLALTRDEPAGRTLAISGGFAYAAWVVGTIIGVTGGSVAADAVAVVEPMAAAVFPVLFVGLAALTVRVRADAGRALVAGAASFGLLLAWPEAGVLGAIAVAVIVASSVTSS